ncbi:helix-turn-helix domain-containing protein [Streptomyces sp. WM6386]|uniref:helix-turn-helix domain-containing protein n=1 Tax=Streptomyces sp. WM6386 TaxID=1415558 RepID=UPI002D219CFC|nr:helix-turn-helix domain-containing protein [Streptomyces sp. WM6386]
MLNARFRTLGFRMDRGAGSMTTSALSGEGDFVIAPASPCHIVERCARIWHENVSRSRGSQEGVDQIFRGLTGGNRMEMKSVIRSLRVLEAVAQHQPVTVGELTKIFGLPKSTVQRTLVTLAEAGWLRANRKDTTRLGDRRTRPRRTPRRPPGIQPLRRRTRPHGPPPRHGQRDHPPLRTGRVAVHGGGRPCGL